MFFQNRDIGVYLAVILAVLMTILGTAKIFDMLRDDTPSFSERCASVNGSVYSKKIQTGSKSNYYESVCIVNGQEIKP